MGGLFGGPTATSLQNPLTSSQGSAAGQTVGNALTQQQQFIQALQAQGGLQNQANVFAQQQALANQLGQIGAGQGPNPAQAMLQQQTGQNIASQAALQAGQRGAASNVGLMARQIGQQGAATQQQAVGQGATLQAQQSLSALQQQAAQQQAMQQVAASQVGSQQGAINAYQQGALGQQGNVLGAQNAYNQAINQNQQNQTSLWGGVASGLGSLGSVAGGLFSGGAKSGSVAGDAGDDAAGDYFMDLGDAALLAANGGQVSTDSTPSGYDDGGTVSDQEVARAQLLTGMTGNKQPAYQGQQPIVEHYTPAQIAAQQASPYYVPPTPKPNNSGGPKSTAGQIISGMAKGGKVKNMVSGGHVPGQAKVKGDSYKNDTVKARLSPGEIVLPRTVAQHPNAPEKAAEFVRAIRAHRGVLRK